MILTSRPGGGRLYVGHRAASAWQIFQKIEFWMTILDKYETKQMAADRARELLSMTTNGVSIPEYYERLMRKRIFGYQEVGSGQIDINSPCPISCACIATRC